VVYRQPNHDHNGCSDDYGCTDHNTRPNHCGPNHCGSDDYYRAVNHYDPRLVDWTYQGQPFEAIPEGVIGFVYLITNTLTGRKYIGKKGTTSAAYKTVKGKRKKLRKESNWKEYYGSCEELLKDIETLGKEHFSREVIFLSRSKGENSYREAKLQFEADVLYHPELFYNSFVGCKIHRKHLKVL
jgi:hypothetical protein